MDNGRQDKHHGCSNHKLGHSGCHYCNISLFCGPGHEEKRTVMAGNGGMGSRISSYISYRFRSVFPAAKEKPRET